MIGVGIVSVLPLIFRFVEDGIFDDYVRMRVNVVSMLRGDALAPRALYLFSYSGLEIKRSACSGARE